MTNLNNNAKTIRIEYKNYVTCSNILSGLRYFSVAMNTHKGVYSLFLAEGERHFIDVHVQETLDH